MASPPKKRRSIPSPPLNNDPIRKILLYLPIQSLLRFRTASKFWRDVIDSPHFRKSHTVNNYDNNNNKYDKVVLLQLNFSEKSVILLNSGKPSNGFPNLHEDDLSNGRHETESGRIVTSNVEVVGPINGLICIHSSTPNTVKNIAVCNPGLGQIKILPPHPTCTLSHTLHAGIGLENDPHDYKVVQLLSCDEHRRLHASVYSRTTNSWRDLACGDEYLRIKEPINSLAERNRGDVLQWRAVRVLGEFVEEDDEFVEDDNEEIILSFETESEEFRVYGNRDYVNMRGIENGKIYAESEKFVLLMVDRNLRVREYEGRIDGNSEVCWDMEERVLTRAYKNVDFSDWWLNRVMWWNECVVFDQFVLMNQLVSNRYCAKVLFCNYYDRTIVESLEVPDGCYGCKFFEYKGSFISP